MIKIMARILKGADTGIEATVGRAPVNASTTTLQMTASSTSRRGAALARGVVRGIGRYASTGTQVLDVL